MDPVAKEDIQNVEHLGDFDHGMIDNVVVDANTTTNFNNNPAAQQQEQQDTIRQLNQTYQDVKQVVLNAERSCATSVKKALKSVERNVANAVAVNNDGSVVNVKEAVEAHTEEEVAGMKLCVKPVVHMDSFEAPC